MNCFLKGLASAAALFVAGVAGSASASTLVDFGNLGAAETYTLANYQRLTSGGFRIMGSGALDGSSMGVLGANDLRNANGGGASLFFAPGGALEMRVDNDDPEHTGFRLLSLDVAELANDGSGGRFWFAGKEIVLDNLAGFQTVTFNVELRGNLMIAAQYPDQAAFQFSNMVVSDVGSYVPEPGTWALMVTGFGMAGGVMRRRRATLQAA